MSSVSTRHHQSESVEVHSSAKPTKPMEKKIAPAHTNSNPQLGIISPRGKEIAPGSSRLQIQCLRWGRRLSPEEINLWGRRLPPGIQFQHNIFTIRRQKSPARLALLGDGLSLYMKPDLLNGPGKI